MATLYERDNGYFYASFYDASKEPERVRLSLGTRSEAEAERILAAIEDPWSGDPFEGVPETTEGRTLRDVIDDFCDHKRSQGRKESTIEKYRDHFRTYARSVGGMSAPASMITTETLREHVHDPKVKPVTGKGRYRHLRAILDYEGRAGLFEGVRKPTPGRKIPNAVRPDELHALCKEVCKDYREKRRKGYCREREIIWVVPAFRFAFFTGLRGQEIARLRWPHVDLRRGRLRIREQKSGHEDTVPLVEQAESILRQMGPREGNEYVFKSPRGDSYERSTERFREHLNRKFAEYRREADLRSEITLHSLRHGFATMLAENGASAFAIKRAMRHADVRTSQIYVHMAGDRLAEEMEEAFSRNL